MNYELLPYPVVLLAVPVGLRGTCYYFRGVYERYVLRHPGACARGEPFGERRVVGSSRYGRLFYLHRLFLYLSLVLMVPHAWDAAATTLRGLPGLWVGNLLQWLDVVLLAGYVGSCHSLRHLLHEGCRGCGGGGSGRGVVEGQDRLNGLHGYLFWLSLLALVLYSGFVYLQVRGWVADFRVV